MKKSDVSASKRALQLNWRGDVTARRWRLLRRSTEGDGEAEEVEGVGTVSDGVSVDEAGSWA